MSENKVLTGVVLRVVVAVSLNILTYFRHGSCSSETLWCGKVSTLGLLENSDMIYCKFSYEYLKNILVISIISHLIGTTMIHFL